MVEGRSEVILEEKVREIGKNDTFSIKKIGSTNFQDTGLFCRVRSLDAHAIKIN